VTAFLLDTNVVSELVRPAPNPGVLRFLSNEGDFWLSVITLHELAYGAALIRDRVRRTRIEGWIEAIKSRFAGRLIGIDGPIVEWAGRARAAAAANGRVITPLDSLIGATAQIRALTVATRNTRDFEPLAVVAVNPWTA
jgi:toxin FitB